MFCKRMWTFWITLTLFALPVISQGTSDTFNKYGFPEHMFKMNCKSIPSFVPEKQELFYQEFVECVKNAVDLKFMFQDFRYMFRTAILALKFNSTLSNSQSSLRVNMKNYCPKITNLINCEETYSSIYTDCLTAVEKQAKKIKRDTIRSIADYFCENDAEQLINFSNGKFLECGMTKSFELKGCLKMFFTTTEVMRENEALMTSSYCKSIDDFFYCTTSIFQQCDMTETTGTLMQSLKTYIKENGICSTISAGDALKLKSSLL